MKRGANYDLIENNDLILVPDIPPAPLESSVALVNVMLLVPCCDNDCGCDIVSLFIFSFNDIGDSEG